jgi:hypothetical protein
LLRGRSPFSADQEHIHHKLLARGLSHRNAVLVLWSVCAIACGVSLLVVLTQGTFAAYILCGFFVFALIAARSLGYLRVEQWRSTFLQGQIHKRRARARRWRGRAIVRSIEQAITFEELFEALKPQHRMHAYAAMRLEVSRVVEPTLPIVTMLWERAHADEHTPVTTTPDDFEVGFELPLRAGGNGRVSYRYRDGRKRLDVDEEALLETIHTALATRVDLLLRGEPPAHAVPQAPIIALRAMRGR